MAIAGLTSSLPAALLDSLLSALLLDNRMSCMREVPIPQSPHPLSLFVSAEPVSQTVDSPHT